MLDSFFFEAPDIGDMQSCLVKCDGSGMGAAWHLDYVTMVNTRTGAGAKFVYRNWFDNKAGWSHTLLPEGKTPDLSTMVPYRVTVFTSDIRGAGTDGDVYLRCVCGGGAEPPLPSSSLVAAEPIDALHLPLRAA